MSKHRTDYMSEPPVDEQLPGLRNLLNPQRLAGMLSLRLPAGSGLDSLTIDHVRYKPATSCVAAFTAQVRNAETVSTVMGYGKSYTSSDFPTAVEKAAARGYADRYELPGFVELPDEEMLVYFFPNDATMKGIEAVAQPKKLQRLLYEHNDRYPEHEWRISDSRMRLEVLRYKPEKRAVVRVTTKAVHRTDGTKTPLQIYVRSHADDRGRDIARLMSQLYDYADGESDLEVPRPIVYLDEPRLLLVAHLEGTPLTDLIAGVDQDDWIERTAKALACLHSFRVEGLEDFGVEELEQQAHATGRTLRSVVPELEGTLTEILGSWREEMNQIAPSPSSFVHGDFYYGQVLIQDDTIGILDFDRSYNGDPLADIGNFCAHLRLMELEGRLNGAEGMAKRFVQAYEGSSQRALDRQAVRLYTIFGLFQLSVRPFRSLRSGWRGEIKQLVDECMRLSA